jgi:hypothetical protein
MKLETFGGLHNAGHFNLSTILFVYNISEIYYIKLNIRNLHRYKINNAGAFNHFKTKIEILMNLIGLK